MPPVWKTDLLQLVPESGAVLQRGKLNPYEPTIAFAINRPPSMTFGIGNEDPLIGFIDELTTRVKAWRSPTPGAPADLKLYNVIGACRDTLGAGGGCAVGTMGPLYYLTRRYRQAEVIFDTVDQHATLKTLIDDENTRHTTQIRTSEIALPAGPARTTTVPQYKQIYAAALDLANLYGGFEFDVLPVEDVADVMGDLRVHYPQQGQHRADVFVEHGLGKRNVIGGERERDIEKVTTDLTMLGRTEGASTLQSLATSSERRAVYGALLESIEGFTDISEQDQLDLLRDEIFALRATPRDVYRIELADTFEYRPFDDFELGDTFPARIREGRIDIDGTVRVWGFEIKVLKTGEERLTALSISPEG
jgi:hypothetical protein